MMTIPENYRDIDSLLTVMAKLRNPEGGCPWDLEQDFRSIAPHTLEEAYEVADAIERDDMEDLKEELGDLLLQVVFHAQMAAEASRFDFSDVVESIVSKMVRRHPHVFGNEVRNSAGEVLARWDEIKAAEKAGKGSDPSQGLLDEIPGNLPGLLQAMKLQKKAAKVGFDWPDARSVAGKVQEELEELQREMAGGDAGRIEEEMGDLLFSCANLSRHLGIDPDAALRRANQKFRTRFRRMEDASGDTDLSALGQGELETLWRSAKSSA